MSILGLPAGTWCGTQCHLKELRATFRSDKLRPAEVHKVWYGANLSSTQQDIQKLKAYIPNEKLVEVTHWNMLQNTVILKRAGEPPVEDQLRQRHK